MVPYGDVANRIYCASAILLPLSSIIAGHHRPPDCTLHDAETVLEGDTRYVSPIAKDHYNAAATVFIIGLTQRYPAC